MNGSNLTYSQITAISQSLQNYSKDMQIVLELVVKIFGVEMLLKMQNLNLIHYKQNLLIFIKQ